MRGVLFYTLLLLTLCGCANEEAEKGSETALERMEQDYEQQIEEVGITDLYNETKWRLYCNHCDVTVKDCKGQPMKGVTYGMLDLQVFFVKFDNGKGEFACTFTYNDKQCTLDEVPGNKVHGIGFMQDGKEPLYYISEGSTKQIPVNCDMQVNINDCPTRMLNPDQPVVRKYLAANREKLNPWFHMQAVKRGFIAD